MNPQDIVKTNCTRCNGTGKAPVQVGPGRPKRSIPCVACERRGYFERSILDRCERLLASSEPTYCAKRDALPMAEAAIKFNEINPWCKITEAIQVQFQGPEFHLASTKRYKREQARKEWASQRGMGLGRIPSRRELADRLASRLGTSLLNWCITRYRSGHLGTTLLGLLTDVERTRMLWALGYKTVGHNEIFGHGVHPAVSAKRG